LAEKAEVPESTILAMFRDEAVPRSVAEKVLDSLSGMLGGKKYTLETVKVELTRGASL